MNSSGHHCMCGTYVILRVLDGFEFSTYLLGSGTFSCLYIYRHDPTIDLVKEKQKGLIPPLATRILSIAFFQKQLLHMFFITPHILFSCLILIFSQMCILLYCQAHVLLGHIHISIRIFFFFCLFHNLIAFCCPRV